MRELPEMMAYVVAAHAIAAVATIVLLAWSWREMKRAEARREEARRK